MVENKQDINFRATHRQGTLHRKSTLQELKDDADFACAPESLIEDWDAPDMQDKVDTWKDFQWLRAKDISSLGPDA